MNKKSGISSIIWIILSLALVGIFCLWWFHDDGELSFERVGIGRHFEYDSKEVFKDIYTFTGKREELYKYYYSEEKEEELLKNIEQYGNWKNIEDVEKVNDYFTDGIEKVNKGYLYYYNFDYHNEVYDPYDYYHNIELGGTLTQYYITCVIDVENNVIWYFETERIKWNYKYKDSYYDNIDLSNCYAN